MKRFHFCKLIVVFMLLCGVVGYSACGSKKNDSSGTTKTDASATTTLPTVSPTPAIPVYSDPIAANDQAITWTETAVVKTMTVSVTDYLRVRKGPDKTYDQVAALTNGMTVNVVAVTSNNWYKLDDGYYVSGEYLV